MAHTDKTDPWAVRIRRGHEWLMEVHRHENGPCTLPKMTKTDFEVDYSKCHYEATPAAWFKLKWCGCWLCRGVMKHNGDKKKARRKDNVKNHLSVRTHNADPDDPDDWPAR